MQVNFTNFFTDYLLNPLSEQIRKRDRAICFIASFFLGLFTAGLLHLGMAIYNWSSRKVDDHTHARDDTEDGVDAVASKSFPQAHRRSPSADARDIQEIQKELVYALGLVNERITDQTTRSEFQKLGQQIFDNASQLLAECAEEPELRDFIIESTKSELSALITTAEEIMTEPDAQYSFEQVKWVQDVTSLIRNSRRNYRPEMGEQLDALLKSVLDVNAGAPIWLNGTALHHLAKYGSPEQFVEIFAMNGINFNCLDNYGNTALVWAIANGNNTVALEIMKYRQDFNVDCHGNTALHLAVAKGYKDRTRDGTRLTVSNLQLVKKLAADGANPNVLNKNGFSALHLACIRRDPEMVKALIENGGDLDVKTEDGRTCRKLLECSFEEANAIIRSVTPPYLLPEADFKAGYQECLTWIS